jgi:hypothetical protein
LSVYPELAAEANLHKLAAKGKNDDKERTILTSRKKGVTQRKNVHHRSPLLLGSERGE